MSPEEFNRNFRIAPVYLFVGEEEFYKVEGIARIRSAVLPNSNDEMGFTEFEPSDTDMATVLDELHSFSLFGGNRLVLLRQADRFFGLKAKSSGDTEENEEEEAADKTRGKPGVHRELLLKYLESPQPNSALVISTGGSWGRYRKLNSRIQKLGFVIDCRRPFENKISQWLIQRARHFKKKLIGRAADRLARDGGGTLLQLDHQLQKLVTYVGERETITEEEVRELVGRAGHDSIFKFTDAAASRNPGRAMEIMHELLEFGATEMYILSMLSWQFRRLWEAKKLQLAGANDTQIAENLKLNRYFAGRFMQQLNSFTEKALRRNHRSLLEADIASKSGYDPEVVVEQLVLKLCL